MQRNLRAVAEAAGVSLSTASRVFTNAATVSDDIRSRVLAASEELGYRPRERGRKFSETTLRRVVLYIRSHNRFRLSSMLGDFYGYVLQGIEAECRRQRLTLVFAHDEAPGATLRLDHLDADGETGILPVVLINNVVDQPVDAVLPDYWGGAQLAVRHLIAAGHTRIAYLHGQDRYTTRLRLDAYKATLAEANIAYDPALVVASSMSLQAANDATKQLIDSGAEFSAICCVNDVSAVGASLALAEAGLRPGIDVSLTGFDDIDLSGWTKLQLTTIHVPKLEMGAVAVRRLGERALDAEGAPQRIILGVHLIQRASVTPRNA
jgi:DNA-binding LacI/PurR family transcriptional regulator